MRKVDDGEKKRKKGKENNDVYSGHYVIASRPPERRPTGTPHARAKIMMFIVATNIVASRRPKRQLTGTPCACAKINISSISDQLLTKLQWKISGIKQQYHHQ